MNNLAFFQNLWVRDPDRVRSMIERRGEKFRISLIRTLILNSHTGKRLQAAFGDLLGRLEFEEASPAIAGDAKTICQPDPTHILAAIERVDPACVVTFGAVARESVSALWNGPLICAPHPAARQRNTMNLLRLSAREFREHLAANGD